MIFFETCRAAGRLVDQGRRSLYARAEHMSAKVEPLHERHKPVKLRSMVFEPSPRADLSG